MATLGFISLGCAKATYDSERIIESLQRRGYHFVADMAEAQLVIINTCGFIQDAEAESFEAINSAHNSNTPFIITGCLGANVEAMRARYPDAIAISGPDDEAAVIAAVTTTIPLPSSALRPANRIHLTPAHYRYLKIAEGCNQKCSFCIIPSMRGPLHSRSMSAILHEAEAMVQEGVQEIIIVAQDTAAYGLDLRYRKELIGLQSLPSDIEHLARELGTLGVWVRLHYIYPYPHVDKLVTLMAEGLILPYLDVPLQHASPNILRAMRRPANVDNMLKRIEHWRTICPELILRTTMICGFPGETEQDFALLTDFVIEAQFNWLGAFGFSPMPGAAATELPDPVDEELIDIRRDILLSVQEPITHAFLDRRIGKPETVLIDAIEEHHAYGRSIAESPEIDGMIILDADDTLSPGEKVNALIHRHDGYDMFAKMLGQN
jgi:ribosomal protein S12 methylthiotransferase